MTSMQGYSCDEGALSRFEPISTFTRVVWHLWNCHGETIIGARVQCCGRTFEEPLQVRFLPLPWCNSKRSSNNLPDVTFLLHLHLMSQIWVLQLDAVAFTLLYCDLSCLQVECNARLCNWRSYTICDRIQVTITGTTSRCQRACHQCQLDILAFYLFWSPLSSLLLQTSSSKGNMHFRLETCHPGTRCILKWKKLQCCRGRLKETHIGVSREAQTLCLRSKRKNHPIRRAIDIVDGPNWHHLLSVWSEFYSATCVLKEFSRLFSQLLGSVLLLLQIQLPWMLLTCLLTNMQMIYLMLVRYDRMKAEKRSESIRLHRALQGRPLPPS